MTPKQMAALALASGFALTSLSTNAADKPKNPRLAIEPGKSYVLMLPDGTCRACPYRGTAVKVSDDGWALFEFDKDAGPRLWRLAPEKPGAAAPAFWVNLEVVVGFTPAPALDPVVKATPAATPTETPKPMASPSPTPQ